MTEQQASSGGAILVADDSLPGLLAVKAMLGKRGCDVDTAADGEQALALATQRRFALILLDEHMPKMRGSEVVAELRGNPGPNQFTRVVSLSGEHSEMVLDEMRCAGFDDCIAKPVSAAQLDKLFDTEQDESNESVYSSVLDQLYADLGTASASRLLGLFVDELNQMCERLAAARDSGNEAELLAVAHILKNSAALYGAQALADLAQQVNEQGARGDVSMASEMIQHCENAAQAAAVRLAVAGGK